MKTSINPLKKIIVISVIISLMVPVSFCFNNSILANEKPSFHASVLSLVNESDILEMIQNVTQKNVKKYLKDFVDFGPKWITSDACNKCGEYIFSTFRQIGLEVEYQEWKYPLRKGKNVIATHHGLDPTSDAVFIICAHYDTWRGCPGANDDGSGIAAMLTIANITTRYNFPHTIRFLAFSGHECGPAFCYGSTAYAKNAYARNENIIAVLNLDMIGNTTKENKIQIHKYERSEWISQVTLKNLEKYTDYIDVVVEPITGILGADQKPFLDYGYDAVFFHQPHSWDPIFKNHQPGDNLSAVNIDFLVNVTKLILVTLIELAVKSINLQLRIIEPYEGYVYLSNDLKFDFPFFYFQRKKDRGMTVIFGGFTAKLHITTNEPLDVVYCIIDDKTYFDFSMNGLNDNISITKSFLLRRRIFSGFHTFRFLVTSLSGKTAYDEMNIFLLP